MTNIIVNVDPPDQIAVTVEADESITVSVVSPAAVTSVISEGVGPQGGKGDTGDTGAAGYTPIKNVDYFDGAKGDKGDTGARGEVGIGMPDGGVTGQAVVKLSLSDYDFGFMDIDLSVYPLKTNVLELDNTTAFTPTTDYHPATKKYVDDNTVSPGGADTNIQYNDDGTLGGVAAFSYHRLTGSLLVGEVVDILPTAPLIIERDVDTYLQVTLQNLSTGVDASSDFILTADDGDDTQGYADFGIGNSGYASDVWDVVGPHDGYFFVDGGNVAIGSLSVGKKIDLFIAKTEHEAHPADVVATIDDSGINLPTGLNFMINNVAIGSSPDFLSLTDTPASYTGQAGNVVSVNPTEDALIFSSLSGLGDMTKAVYDPTSINASPFNVDNQTDGTTYKRYSATEQTKLSGIASGAEVNVQSDWNQADTGSDDFIKNKPTIPASTVPATTVVSELTYGQASVVGTSTNYAREDHTHGTPEATGGGVSEELAIAYAAAL